MRVVLSLLLALALVVLAASSPARAARAPEDRPPERFSADVVQLIDAGWSIGDLGGETSFRLVLVAPDRQRALLLEIELDQDGGAPLAYRRAPAAVPGDVKVYPASGEIVAALRGGPLASLAFECGGLVASNDAGAVVLDELDWYVVRDRAEGDEAGRLFARHLARRLARGGHLVDAFAHDTGVEVQVYGHGLGESLHVQLGAAGEVAVVEVRETPRVYEKAELPGERRLGRALRRAGRVERITVDGLDLTLVVAGKPLSYRFRQAEAPEGCGC